MSTFPIPLSPSFSFLFSSSFFPLARISIWFETCSSNLLLSVSLPPPFSFSSFFLSFPACCLPPPPFRLGLVTAWRCGRRKVSFPEVGKNPIWIQGQGGLVTLLLLSG